MQAPYYLYLSLFSFFLDQLLAVTLEFSFRV
jgi:hypothetical protein